MKVYHGTTAAYLRSIVDVGALTSRSENGNNNFKDFPSGEDRIYFSDCYAPWYAMGNTDRPYKWLFAEVDTDDFVDHRLIPDEDYIEQWSRMAGSKSPQAYTVKGETIEERTADCVIRAANLSFTVAKDSLERLGAIAIHYQFIQNCKLYLFDPWDLKQQPVTHDLGTFHRSSPETLRNKDFFCLIDPTISIMNHAIMGGFYEQVTLEIISRSQELEQWQDLKPRKIQRLIESPTRGTRTTDKNSKESCTKLAEKA